MTSVRRAGLAAALAAAPFALAYRFALVYRVRAGFPKPQPPVLTPAYLGMPFESLTVDAPGTTLPGWFIPAGDGAPGPGVVVVHGWESARDRTLPLAQVLHAVGYHVLTVDVRGHGANPPEELPVSGGEFGSDALAAFRALMERPEVTEGGIAGHSMGGIGAILAAAADPRVKALVSTAAPADPYRLTRQTFRLARLPIPDPIAWPLAWLTTRVFLQPRGHTVEEISAARAIARFAGPILLLHGDADQVVPVSHMARLADAAGRPVESHVFEGGSHSWLYEDPTYRSAVARFLAEAFGGPLAPDEAAAVAARVQARRIPDLGAAFHALQDEPGGFRSLARVAMPRQSRGPGAPDSSALPLLPGLPGLTDLPGLPDEESPAPDEPFEPLTGPTSHSRARS